LKLVERLNYFKNKKSANLIMKHSIN